MKEDQERYQLFFLLKSAGNIWGNLQLETPKVDSLFNQEKVHSVYYKVSV